MSAVLGLTVLGACTTVKRNAGSLTVRNISEPEIGSTITVSVGDHMVRQGVLVEEEVLVVFDPIDGALYDIPAKTYLHIGFDEKDDFFQADGVRRQGIADPISALALGKAPDSKLRVITTFGASQSYEGNYRKETRASERQASFQQTLIYSGRVGNKVNIGYREFSSNIARPAFNNDVEYDLNDSQTIGYKGALIEIVEATNSHITFKLLKNFNSPTGLEVVDTGNAEAKVEASSSSE